MEDTGEEREESQKMLNPWAWQTIRLDKTELRNMKGNGFW